MAGAAWPALERDIVSCERCPRLRRHCAAAAEAPRRAHAGERYWGRPVPGFGDRAARLALVGLAPAAHGANRTGRMFTGDRSGEWLYASLWRAGLAGSSESRSRSDGLRLRGAFVTASCRCAPPANRPKAAELARCSEYLDREFELLPDLLAAVALGRIAWDALLRRARRVAPEGFPRPAPAFAHGASARLPLGPRGREVALLGCYHPSQQNTFTGRLTRPMLDEVIREAARAAGLER